MSDSCSFHFESLQGPISGGDSSNESLGYTITVQLELLDRVEFGCSVRLLENFVDVGLEIVVKLLEEILE